MKRSYLINTTMEFKHETTETQVAMQFLGCNMTDCVCSMATGKIPPV